MTPLYPLFADLKGRQVLVVGGGAVAERKVRSLLRCGARILVGAPRLTAALKRWADEGVLTYLPGAFDPEWLETAWLTIAATGDRQVNACVKAAADERRVLSNVVDDPELSSFQVPAVIDRAPLVIAVSSAGTAPVLARRVRERVEALFDPSLGALAELAGRYRQAIRQAWPDAGARRRFYDWLYDGPVPERLIQSDPEGAEQLVLSRLAAAAAEAPLDSRVTWITVCVEDPGRLMLRDLRAMNEADVLVYPAEIPAVILDMARRDADRRVVDARSSEDLRAQALASCAGYRRAVVLQVAAGQKSNSGSMASPACSQ